ncbi:MAG: CoA-binding protein [Bacilli bacterium]|nr:CoA-binding protein [Bacilli bacterium]
MMLDKVMKLDNFVVVGNTLVEDKYAYKIKQGLVEAGYKVACVGKELSSINDVDFEIDVLDLCINPHVGINLLKENKKKIKTVVIQPGAESEEIIDFLKTNQIDYLEGCLLVGLKLYKK